MPVLVQVNLHTFAKDEWTSESELQLIAAFNRLPGDITAENILKRAYRAWLLRITEETNARSMKAWDFLDVTLKLQQLRKEGRLKGATLRKGVSTLRTEAVEFDPESPDDDRKPKTVDSSEHTT